MPEVATRTIVTQLRGVDVVCTVAYVDGRPPTVGIETHALDLDQGLRAVSKFAGYCQRTLVLTASSAGDEQWAGVLASYFGFGLVLDNGDRRGIMEPPELDPEDGSEARRRFLQRVLTILAADD